MEERHSPRLLTAGGIPEGVEGSEENTWAVPGTCLMMEHSTSFPIAGGIPDGVEGSVGRTTLTSPDDLKTVFEVGSHTWRSFVGQRDI
eukprot:CAMPEP_0172638616 /NCGR_PEP_ID=MMETSP1068-20121228/214710_1 /TAXON_ID=35684 /ORGANISM="Pseudopedinella elastica, Strain CCMP716" /LENGTH=87 /DNA_ID=CAMNT_0013451553 /DNA_START=266 /DNA_END=529 /DNA_ORIENTATION=+